MISRIDIKQFGCFSDFNWSSALREGQTAHECKRLNILYGRNYSGKTTLSRVLRSFEVGRLPENFDSPEFSLNTEDGTFVQTDIQNHSLDIRVYNKDFVDENLSFLKDHTEGEVSTFAILGSENKEIEQKIEEKETELGSAEAKSGLKHELAEKQKDFSSKNRKAKQADQALEEKLRRHANDVIKPSRMFGNPGYNIAAIKQDIVAIENESFSILVEDEVQRRHDILKEETLPDIEEEVSYRPAFTTLIKNAKNVLEKEVKPSAPIQDLLNDAALQAWVRTGMDHHRDRRTDCGFCGQALPSDLWEKLDAHFSKESSELEEELTRQISAVQEEIDTESTIRLPNKESFYVSERTSFESQRKDFFGVLKSCQAELRKILKQLQAREKDIFKIREFPDIVDFSEDLQDKVEVLNKLIKNNNSITKTLPTQQQNARDELRQNAVAIFVRDIDLGKEKKKVADLEEEARSSKEETDELANTVKSIEEEVEELRTKLQDEKKGAEKVNEYLNHYFGHEGLRLEAVEDPIESKFKFQIMRGDDPAYNMSEGECSLVAFCYFMARLEDIETKGKELIIYIDDPISSLDSNHIFFVFSLIESILALPDKNEDGSPLFKYKQLFISTHNLDFFKYLIRIKQPKGNQGGTQFFLIEKAGEKSTIRIMPKYLKDYQTEFHYLFHQIYRCKEAQGAHENHEVFYNFGNNLRKFLEAYLFYKYPYKDDQASSSERLMKFFGEDATATALTNRVSNELSHLEKIFDRSMRPIEIPEIPSVANFVLDKMYEKDKDQFNALLQSIGEPER
jgi:wobble nucleotide-excising tRNase